LKGGGGADGNRVWRVNTPSGPVVQKLYRERHGALRILARRLAVWLAGRKTRPDALGRWRTERDVLAAWRAARLRVPRDRSGEHPELVGECVTLLEFVKGRSMAAILHDSELPRAERDRLLERFARRWSRRHRMVLDSADRRLIQEHGTFDHVLVHRGRLCCFDFEQAYRSGPLVLEIAREVSGYMRSLHKTAPDEATFEADVRALVSGYREPALLRACVGEYVHSPSLFRRLVWRMDRYRRRGRTRPGDKYRALDALARALG
jgi:hypothetical protein